MTFKTKIVAILSVVAFPIMYFLDVGREFATTPWVVLWGFTSLLIMVALYYDE